MRFVRVWASQVASISNEQIVTIATAGIVSRLIYSPSATAASCSHSSLKFLRPGDILCMRPHVTLTALTSVVPKGCVCAHTRPNVICVVSARPPPTHQPSADGATFGSPCALQWRSSGGAACNQAALTAAPPDPPPHLITRG
jgi:hypothetical protein